MTSPLAKIKTHGWWEVTIRPEEFIAKRLPDLLSLESILRATSVQIRGWDFPHFGKEPVRIGLDYIESSTDWSDHVAFWRFFQSGQFYHTMAIRTDWADAALFSKRGKEWQPGDVLLVMDTLYCFVEIFELTARLASGPLPVAAVVVDITLNGLANRQLLLDSPNRVSFSTPRVASVTTFPQTVRLGRDDAIGRARANAYSACRELFTRFGWAPDDQVLEGMVDELRRYGFKV